MAIDRVRRRGRYAPLSATYWQDDAVVEVSALAELLFCRGLAFAAGREADGYISAGQIEKVLSAKLPDVLDLAEELVEAGVWERHEKGYRIRSWLGWNKSAEEINGALRADSARKKSELAKPSARNPTGFRAESDPRPRGFPTPETETETETETEEQTLAPSSRPARPKPDLTDFPEFWAAYPNRKAKGSAEKAWLKAIAKAPAREIIAAAASYRDDPNRNPQYTAHPATWLNGERWADERSADGRPLVERARASPGLVERGGVDVLQRTADAIDIVEYFHDLESREQPARAIEGSAA